MRAILCLIFVACAPLLVSCRISSHIISGTAAAVNQFPYQAAISVTQYGGAMVRCGGSLIDRAYVLTAAHCFNNAENVTVRLGSNSFTSGGQFWNINITSQVIIHNHFSQTAIQNSTNINIHNNIALIRLTTYAIIDASTAVIKILPKSMACDTTLRQFQVAGWGVTNDVAAGGQFSDQLNFVKLNELTNDACMGIYGLIDPNQMCAKGDATQSACKGDAGSPLVYNNYVVAMVSWGITTCTASYARVNQLVTPYADWIALRTGIGSLANPLP